MRENCVTANQRDGVRIELAAAGMYVSNVIHSNAKNGIVVQTDAEPVFQGGEVAKPPVYCSSLAGHVGCTWPFETNATSFSLTAKAFFTAK